FRVVNRERQINTLVGDRIYGPRPCISTIVDLSNLKLVCYYQMFFFFGWYISHFFGR
uniref:DDE Tnp4 domain-containing protein n=1 Tax=Ascaris lumbricoides TaxID=6252 RepID=A0A0M3HMA1_ASCLU